jgi:hypothetical protein
VVPLLNSVFREARIVAAGSLTSANLVEDRTQICASLADLVAAYPKKLTGGWLPVDRVAAASQRAALLANGARRIVALAWQPTGSAQNGLEQFAPLFENADIAWMALPMAGIPAALAQLLSAPDCPVRHDAAWTRNGLQSVAELLASVDLLISTEDLAATLAGALGKPVWKIAGPNPHWSWGAESATSKWHPTARIFRAVQGMEQVMTHIRAELEHDAGA